MFSTAYAKAEATMTNAMSTMAVSSPLMAFLFRANLFRDLITLLIFFSLFYDHETRGLMNHDGLRVCAI